MCVSVQKVRPQGLNTTAVMFCDEFSVTCDAHNSQPVYVIDGGLIGLSRTFRPIAPNPLLGLLLPIPAVSPLHSPSRPSSINRLIRI